MNTNIICILLSTIVVEVLSLKECPPAEDIYPCKCDMKREFRGYNGGIFCGGDQIFDMKKIFHRLSKTSKYIDSPYEFFVFSNSKIVEIPEDIFGNFTFKAIFVGYPYSSGAIGPCCENLKKINYKAFSSSFKTTQELYLNGLNLRSWKSPYSLINLSSQFKNLTDLIISSLLDLGDLDDISFGKNLSTLRSLQLNLNSIKGSLFEELNNLQYLAIFSFRDEGTLDHIPSNAFQFNNRKNNDTKFNLELEFNFHNHLNGYSFEIGSLTNFNTIVHIRFHFNPKFKFFQEIIFFPFLEKNMKNTLSLDKIDCSDCRNYWIFMKKDILKERLSAHCDGDEEHGNIWENEDKFEHCKTD